MPAFSKIHSDGADPEDSPLETRNIEITDRKNNDEKVRTSMRLEPYVWDALYDIAEREGRTHHEICDLIAQRKHRASSLTAAVRLFILVYFRIAADEKGHAEAGHGSGDSSLFDRIIAKMNQPAEEVDRRKGRGRRKRPSRAAPEATAASGSKDALANGAAPSARSSAVTLAGAGSGRRRAKGVGEPPADGSKEPGPTESGPKELGPGN